MEHPLKDAWSKVEKTEADFETIHEIISQCDPYIANSGEEELESVYLPRLFHSIVNISTPILSTFVPLELSPGHCGSSIRLSHMYQV